MNNPTRKCYPFSSLGQLASTVEGYENDLKSPEDRVVLALISPPLDRARRSTRRWRVLSLVFLVALVTFAWSHYHQFLERGVRLQLIPFRTLTVQESGYGEAHVPIIPIKGAITGDPLGPEEVSNTPRYLYDALELAKSEKYLAAVVLYIDSGGGDLYSSVESYRVVRQFAKETKIPVYAYVSRQSFSGAYLIALAAKEIAADPVALVGNIGVIMRRTNTYQFGRRLGIQELNITTGPLKDEGGQWKKQNSADDAIDRRAIFLEFEEFLAAVKHGRPGLAGVDLRAEAKKSGGITSGARFVARMRRRRD